MGIMPLLRFHCAPPLRLWFARLLLLTFFLSRLICTFLSWPWPRAFPTTSLSLRKKKKESVNYGSQVRICQYNVCVWFWMECWVQIGGLWLLHKLSYLICCLFQRFQEILNLIANFFESIEQKCFFLKKTSKQTFFEDVVNTYICCYTI